MPRTRTSARATDKDRELARRIGQRIREARHRAGLTQQQLAGERYTKAYVSALETGIASFTRKSPLATPENSFVI